MKTVSVLFALGVFASMPGQGLAQTSNDDAAHACQSEGLQALKQRSPEITDLVLDMESLAVSAADTKVDDVPITTVVMGEAYIARGGETGKADRFVCLLGEEGKVLLTFFTAQ